MFQEIASPDFGQARNDDISFRQPEKVKNNYNKTKNDSLFNCRFLFQATCKAFRLPERL
ncbi:MAG: hypothetical protein IJV35_03245 [Neisseriaceae bacterium]|nr:hypothetical protein [Neisseriaceae bacterium]